MSFNGNFIQFCTGFPWQFRLTICEHLMATSDGLAAGRMAERHGNEFSIKSIAPMEYAIGHFSAQLIPMKENVKLKQLGNAAPLI